MIKQCMRLGLIGVMLLTAAAAAQHVISGSVYYADTETIYGVKVELRNQTGTLLTTNYSDYGGYFQFDEVADGAYSLWVYGPDDDYADLVTWGITVAGADVYQDVAVFKVLLRRYPFDHGIVTATHPQLTWRPQDDASYYIVTFYERIGENYSQIALSPYLYSAEWTISQALTPGATYGWTLGAYNEWGQTVGISESMSDFTVAAAESLDSLLTQARGLMADRTLSGWRAADALLETGVNTYGASDPELVFLHTLSRSMMLLFQDDGGDGVGDWDSMVELLGLYDIMLPDDFLDNLEPEFTLNEFGYYRKPQDAPTRDDIRDKLDVNTIPRLQEILTELATIDSGDNFQMYLYPGETGLSKDVDVDYSDVLVLRAALKALKAQLETRWAYDTNMTEADEDAIVQKYYAGVFDINEDLLESYPYFLTLLPTPGHEEEDGLARLQQAKQNTLDAIADYFAAIDAIRAEGDDQADDLIYISPKKSHRADVLDERLTTLQISLSLDTFGEYPWETTRIYTLEGSVGGEFTLTLTTDLTDNEGSAGSFLLPPQSAFVTDWRVEWVERSSDEWHIELEPNRPGIVAKGFLLCQIDGEVITSATFDYWGEGSGTISGLSGQLSDTTTVTKRFDPTPLFAGEVDGRDMLPAFGPDNQPLPGTMGSRLENDSTLGGILPDMTQDDWTDALDMQPAGEFDFPAVVAGEITVDGSLDDWVNAEAGPIFIDGVGDADFDPLYRADGLDIHELYLAHIAGTDTLYGAITSAAVEFLPFAACADTQYTIVLEFINGYESVKILVYFTCGAISGTAEVWRDGEMLESGIAIRNGDVAEFSIIPVQPRTHSGGKWLTTVDSEYVVGGLAHDADENSPELQYTSVGGVNAMMSISGTVTYSDYPGAAIIIEAYNDPYDPEGSVLAATMTDGSGAYTLDGIGYGWSGYVRAWAYWRGDTSMYAVEGPRVRSDYQYVDLGSGPATGVDFVLARTLTVGSGGDYTTIQDAIDAAQDGDTVLIMQGLYTSWGNWDINFSGKAITVEGENGPSGVIIDCSDNFEHRGFVFNQEEGRASVLQGVTIINGQAGEYASDYDFGPWWGNVGGAIVCDGTSPTLRECVFESCEAYYGAGGALACVSEASPLVRNCLFTECSAYQGGAAACLGDSEAAFDHVQFLANIANISSEGGEGGAFYGDGGSSRFTNCLFAGNESIEYGSAVYGLYHEADFVNCTFTENYTHGYYTIYARISPMCLTNCIIWNNEQTSLEMPHLDGDFESVTHSCLEDYESGDGYVLFGGAANGNIDTNPLFVTEGYWDNYGWMPGDYHLQNESPCIDTGDDAAVIDIADDLDGAPRLQGEHVDMGAYEGAAGPLPDITAYYISLADDPDYIEYTFGMYIDEIEITSNFYWVIYASLDQLFEPAEDHYLTMTEFGAPFPPGWSYNSDNQTILKTDINLPAGNYYLIAVADPDDPPSFYASISESDETNNWVVSEETFTLASGEEGFYLSTGTQGQGEVLTYPSGEPYGYYPPYTQVELYAQPASGWRFAYWMVDDEFSDNMPLTMTMDNNHSVIAIFEQDEVPQYTLYVTVASGSGTIQLTPSGGIYNEGTPVQVRAVPASGWRFDHWTGDLVEWNSSNPANVGMYYNIVGGAVFERTTTPDIVYYDLTTTVAAGQGTISPASGTYQQGQTITLTATPAAGYRVKNWTGTNSDPAAGQTSVQVTFTNNRQVTVAFEKVFNLTASVSGGLGTISPASGAYSEGSVVTLTVTPPAHYRVVSWSGADTTPAAGQLTNTVTMDADKTVSVVCAPMTGSLNVAIVPTVAQIDGAQWRMDGGAWRNSGDVMENVLTGGHTISFKNVLGWTTPVDITVTVNSEALTTAQGTYVQAFQQIPETGSLRVMLTSPDGVISPAPQWRLTGVSGWLAGGTLLENIEAGVYSVEFGTVSGWTAPENAAVQINVDEITTVSGVYHKVYEQPQPQTGTLTVTAAATSQARWRLAGQNWQPSGVTLSSMDPNVYTLQFSSLDAKWVAPGPQTVVVYPGQTTTVSPVFTAAKNAVFVDPEGSNTSGNGDSDAPYGTIQWAIDRAAAGETIIVQPGTYSGTGNVDLDFRGKAIILRSAEGAATCIIECNGSESHPHRGLWFHNDETAASVVDGFTITGGWATVGGGIFCDEADPVIRNCVIKNNTSLYSGAGVRCNNAAPVIEDCVISENHAQMCGGGIFCHAESEPAITRTEIRANTADGCGGGVYCCVDSAPTLTNCLIVENEAASTGGGVYTGQNSTLTMNFCTIVANQANIGAGVRAYGAQAALANSIIWNNTSRLTGRQIDTVAAGVSLSCCNVQNSGGSGDSWDDTYGVDAGGNMDMIPLFINPEATQTLATDYHLSVISPCIDAGDPNVSCVEPAPNGDRVNLGAYGNTPGAAATLDSDSDGLTNPLETRWGLNPYSVDSDSDGLSDVLEIILADADTAYFPFQPATATGVDFNGSIVDTDYDGLDDFAEANYDGDPAYNPYNLTTGAGTDPNALCRDTDNDGMTDGAEVKYGFNPLNPADADLDKDGDGFSNRAECQAGSNPLDKNSVPPLFNVDFELAQLTGGELGLGRVRLSVEIPDTDDIESVTFAWPGNAEISLPPRSQYTAADLLGEMAPHDLAGLEAAFPAGVYTVTRHYSDGHSDAAMFEHWYGPYPTAAVNVYPLNEQADVALTPTLKWTGSVSRIDIYDSGSDALAYTAAVSPGVTTVALAADVLTPATTYRLELTNRNGLTPHLAHTAVSIFTTAAPVIIYVDDDATGLDNGTSWENAYNTLSKALTHCEPGAQIRVAAGTYYPQATIFTLLTSDDSQVTFILKENVSIMGGYAGLSNPDAPDVRSVIDYPSYFSGHGVQARHIFTGAHGAVLDGCVIDAGDAAGTQAGDNIGAGLLCVDADMNVSNCIFLRNQAEYGGAVGVVNSNVQLTNCLFVDNTADYGGAVCTLSGTVTLTNCTLADNSAKDYGGGVFTWEGSSLLQNTIVWNNTAPRGKGPQLALAENGHLTVNRSCIKGGEAGVYRASGTTLTWDAANIIRSPRFSADSAGNGNLADRVAQYVSGSFSVCVDGGDNAAVASATDLLGNSRIYNDGIVDIGAFEFPGPRALPDTSVMTTSELTLRAGVTAGRGSATFKGNAYSLAANPDINTIRSLLEYLTIQVGPFQQTFDLTTQPAIFTPTSLILLGNASGGGRVYLTVKFETHRTSVHLMLTDVNLGGITSPCDVQIALGDYQHLAANPAATVPLTLLAGYADVLRVDRLRFTHNESRPGSDMLNVSGGLCLKQTPADITAEDLTVTYGDYQLTIPAGQLRRFGAGGLMASTRVESASVLVLIDLNRCTFQVMVLNAAIGHQADPETFGLKFAGFDQSVTIP